MPRIIYDKIIRQTDLAIQYQIDGQKFWIPISQIQYEDLGNHILEIPDWLLKEKKKESTKERRKELPCIKVFPKSMKDLRAKTMPAPQLNLLPDTKNNHRPFQIPLKS